MAEPTVDDVAQLNPLVGEWAMASPVGAAGEASFAWLRGERFLVQRWTMEPPEFPDGVAVLGADPDTGRLVQHYFDSRGVRRTYHTSLRDRVWRLWREDPDWWQRFTGTISEDGATIAGRWENSSDSGRTWEHDFDLAYTRASHNPPG